MARFCLAVGVVVIWKVGASLVPMGVRQVLRGTTWTMRKYAGTAAVANAWQLRLKFFPQRAEFFLSNGRKWGSGFCLRFDLIDQLDGAFLLGRWRSGDLESGRVLCASGCAAGVAREG